MPQKRSCNSLWTVNWTWGCCMCLDVSPCCPLPNWCKKIKLWTFLSKLSEQQLSNNFQLKGSMPIMVFKIINKVLFTKDINETLRLQTSLLVTLKKLAETNPKNKTHQKQLKKPRISGSRHCILNLTNEKFKIQNCLSQSFLYCSTFE